jgi:hypothetical protein
MLSIHRVARYGLLLLAAIALIGSSEPVRADSGSVHVVVTKAGFIVGAGGGRGVLVFHGRRYPLTVSGMSIGFTIGASTTELVGRARNLRQPSDIAGTYSSVGSGIAVAGGLASVRLQNANGVIIELHGRKVGFEFAANLSGVEIRLN